MKPPRLQRRVIPEQKNSLRFSDRLGWAVDFLSFQYQKFDCGCIFQHCLWYISPICLRKEQSLSPMANLGWIIQHRRISAFTIKRESLVRRHFPRQNTKVTRSRQGDARAFGCGQLWIPVHAIEFTNKSIAIRIWRNRRPCSLADRHSRTNCWPSRLSKSTT